MDFDKLVSQVQHFCPKISSSAALRDLKLTKSVQATVNRIYDGTLFEPLVHSLTSSDYEDNNLRLSGNTRLVQETKNYTTSKSTIDETVSSKANDAPAHISSDCILISSDDALPSKPAPRITRNAITIASDSEYHSTVETQDIDHCDSDEAMLLMDTSVLMNMAVTKKKIRAPLEELNASKRKKIQLLGSDEESLQLLNSQKEKVRAPPEELTSKREKIQVYGSNEERMHLSNSQKEKARTSVKEKEDKKTERELAKKNKEIEKIRKSQERERQKALKNIEKLALNAAKKLEKQLESEKKQVELNLLKEARSINKMRQKLECVKDMIVDIDTQFIIRKGAVIMMELEAHGVGVNPITQPIPNTLSWRKRCVREWDQDDEIWKKCPEKIIHEQFVLCRIYGEEFCAYVTGNNIQSLVSKIRSSFPKKKIIFLIQGLYQYINSKSKELRTDFDNAVRSIGTTEPRNDMVIINNIPNKTFIQNTLLYLQLEVQCIVQHTESPEETADYIAEFTKEIAILHETEKRDEFALKLKFGDTIKSGANHTDTYRKMLEQIFLVSESVSLGISEHYKTLGSLYTAYESLSESNGQMLLANIQITRGNQRMVKPLGKTVSKRVYDILMNTNPDALMLT